MIVIRAEDENTVTDGNDFVSLHKISVSFPTGQNLDKPSMAVKGIVRDKRMSTEARRVIKWPFAFSLGLRGRTRKLFRKSFFCILALLLPIRWSAIMTDMFEVRDKTINNP